MDERIIREIKNLVSIIKKEKGIINEIIRDDVFIILQACECTVLYYPVWDNGKAGCDGFHLEKPVNDKMEQFVFINTINTRERQAFTAAHELGHIWKVDERLRMALPGIEIDTEVVINRFAAELLMSENLFREAYENYLMKIQYNKEEGIECLEVVKLIVYLMNYFFVPFKSVLYRFNELNLLDQSSNAILLKYKNEKFLGSIFKAEQYTRLGIVNELKSLDDLNEYLLEVEEKELINSKKIESIRKTFDIVESKGNDEKILRLGSN